MAREDLFLCKDYRDALKDQLLSLKKSVGKTYTTQNLADHCCVQRTYLSKVLNLGAHLNEDQFYNALEYLKFSEKEKFFLELLHQMQRSANHERKKVLALKIEKIKKESLRADKYLNYTEVISQNEDIYYLKYYLNPYVQITHMFLTIGYFQNHPDQVRCILKLNQHKWKQIISTLFDLQLIAYENKKLISLKNRTFLSAKSEVFPIYHQLIKNLAENKITEIEPDNKHALSMLFTCSEDSWNHIRLKWIKFIKDIEKTVAHDKNPTHVYQLSGDLFSWSQK